MLHWFCGAEDKQDHGSVVMTSSEERRFEPVRWRLNAKPTAWLLVGIAWFAFSGCSPSENQEKRILRYEVLHGNAIITGIVDHSVEELIIPNEIDSIPVTRIHDRAFWECDGLTSVTIPDSVIRTRLPQTPFNFPIASACSPRSTCV
jgi:hypothetical protein